ncbi:hypothetical protein B0T26DRAFT_753685 [Lasiosphaeria miniovina]|uniref:Uncharacterized protein n=1 Tax=Lasiosphaeria miniovina TaxID=1954250 RepID=A0AA40AD27_9PEZI|nr:uncharacterized protein B0T26DRAFT_753685 [Lasiosphaeria miniovina]KAK0713595.1 hypothetical protein B0T26DRAFT_753685 [Lasiosphaeria miniovina]
MSLFQCDKFLLFPSPAPPGTVDATLQPDIATGCHLPRDAKYRAELQTHALQITRSKSRTPPPVLGPVTRDDISPQRRFSRPPATAHCGPAAPAEAGSDKREPATMRSHPYTPPPPLPPVLDELADELAAILPNQEGARHRRASDGEVEMCELDPDTSRLLPVRPKRHHVRIQGKLVLVRSISTANLRPPPGRRQSVSPSPGGTTPRSAELLFESAGVSKLAARRSRARRSLSLDDGAARQEADRAASDDTETEEEARDTITRDRQLRGYGIGGAGNIRRPTEVINFPARRPGSTLSLLSSVLPSSSPTSPMSPSTPDRKRWNIREMFGLTADRKGKSRGRENR